MWRPGNWSGSGPARIGFHNDCYLANGTDWHNDWAADAYLPNEFGSDNSVVSLKESALPAPKKAASKKKA